MAPVSTKRARTQVASSEAKKARVVDPVAQKIELISKTITDPSCSVAPESHREMLLVSIPHTLAVPSDERHEFQKQVAQMVGKVLNDHVADWENQVSDSNANIGVSGQKADEAMKLVYGSATKIDAQEAEVAKFKGVVDEDSAAVTVAEDVLQSASKEVAEFDDKLQKTIVEKEQCSSVYNESFVALKSGASEAKEASRLLKRLEPTLKKLSTESSLLSAIAPALKKSPGERGPFDTMAVEGTEAIFVKHLGELKEQIDKADVFKLEKVSAEATAQEALKAATEKHMTSEGTLKAAEEELASLEAKHKELYSVAEATSQASATSHCVAAVKEGGLAQAKEVLSTFTELLERQSTMPEAAAEVEKLQAVVEDGEGSMMVELVA